MSARFFPAGLLVLVLAGSATAPALAQIPEVSNAATPAAAGAAAFDPEAATRDYLGSVPAEQKARSDAYFEGGYLLQLVWFVVTCAVLLLILHRGWSASMRERAERLTRRRALQTAIYWTQYLLLTTLLVFPLTVYSDFVREHQYGLATQSFGDWLVDQLKGLGLGIVLGGIAIVLLYGVLRRATHTWWIWGTAVSLVFLVIALVFGPVYIAPLFNTYTRLEDPKLRDPILSLARANGVQADAVYQVDASRQTTRISANVSGFLGTQRITLNDNLLRRCTEAEILAVMGHEIGHYVLNHVEESLLFFGVVFLGGFAFLNACSGWALARWGSRWRIRGVDDPAGLPLALLLLTVYFFVLTPVLNTYIRVNEAEADLFGLNSARQPDGFAQVTLKLGEYRKLEPGPLEEWIFYDHPSGLSRIRMSMHWKAESIP